MKSKIISSLKIILPLGFGVFLIWLFYDALCEEEKVALFSAFGTANYFWVIISLIFGFASHLSRAWRWRYLLEPMGYKVSFWNSYHSVMIGYIVNLVFPRAGEASRAGVLAKTEKVPFQKSFGTIMAERGVDLGMLGIVALIGLALQMDKLDMFTATLSNFDSTACGNTQIFGILGAIVKYGILLGLIGAIAAFAFSKKFRTKLIEFIKGFWEGIIAIFKTKNKLKFIVHTIFIWLMYVLMFGVCFQALPSTSELGIDAVLAGFIAGTIGIIVVQGGIGVYPVLVGLILTSYISTTDASIDPDALALGWIIWTSQTAMVIILGLVSLALNGKNVNLGDDEPLQSAKK